MTKGLQNLITRLDAGTGGRDGNGYESVHRKLIKYFAWRGCVLPEALADETIDRVARRLDEQQQVDNLMAYFYGVARLVYKEYERKRIKEQQAFASLPTSTEQVGHDGGAEQGEARRSCSKKCLRSLTDLERQLITAYCKPDGRPKSVRRQEIAALHGIKVETLRLRIFRIREHLHECVRRCLGDGPE